MTSGGKKDILRYMSGTTESIAVDSAASLRVHQVLDPQIVVAELGINGHLISNGAAYNPVVAVATARV